MSVTAYSVRFSAMFGLVRWQATFLVFKSAFLLRIIQLTCQNEYTAYVTGLLFFGVNRGRIYFFYIPIKAYNSLLLYLYVADEREHITRIQ